MSRLIRYLRGSVRFRLTGAAPEQCLNALAAARLEFWDIEREDALHLSLSVPAREAERLQRLAAALPVHGGGDGALRPAGAVRRSSAAARPVAGLLPAGRGDIRAAGIRLDDRGRGK